CSAWDSSLSTLV
nr:immunoglobulin light chain junction region [Macaca mulatta]